MYIADRQHSECASYGSVCPVCFILCRPCRVLCNHDRDVFSIQLPEVDSIGNGIDILSDTFQYYRIDIQVVFPEFIDHLLCLLYGYSDCFVRSQ